MRERRVTQVRLADEFQVSQAAVSKWLKGSVPSGVTLVRLARFFGVTAEELVGLGPVQQESEKPLRSASARRSVKTPLDCQRTCDLAAEVDSLFDRLKARIKADLATCQPEEARARMGMLARLLGAEDPGPPK